MTLIELLVAISIIATLSAMFLGASRAAMEHSRAARTRSTIDKLHTLVMERYADYETRRVDLDNHVINLGLGPNINSVEKLVASLPAEGGHDIRLLALRELMKFEMPDRWSDIDLELNPTGKPTNYRDKATVFIKNVPPIARIYERRYRQALQNTGDAAKVNDNQGAECLYMLVMLHTGDGEARTMFSTQDIGDVDEDGLPEFLDGWGNPIDFVRWPAGFVVRSSLMSLAIDPTTGQPEVPHSGDSENDHDPFDPFRRNWVIPDGSPALTPPPQDFGVFQPYILALRGNVRPSYKQIGFRTVPLIYSAGPDGQYDIVTARNPPGNVVMSLSQGVGDYLPGLFNPYFPTDEDDNYSMGAPHLVDGEDLSIDNIHNHLDTTR